jgi:hemerythrin-like domain-containing protein
MPIRRHPALAPLSRDHHVALQLARGLITGGSAHLRAELPSEPRALADHVRALFASEIEQHFAVEEQSVLPAVKGRGDLDAVCAEIAAEHGAMRGLVSELADPALTNEQIMDRLDRLGRLLEAHVRKEERSLYEGVQGSLDEGELATLGATLARHLTS